MKDTYTLEVAGLKRELKICPVNESLSIAGFIMFGDTELTVACGVELLEKAPMHDVIVTAESKGIPIAYEMARQGCNDYIVARKSVKLYMKEPEKVTVKSISTEDEQTLYLDSNETDKIRNKRVLIVDDVISTGESLKALETLVANFGGNIVGKAAVLAEGDAAERDDIIFLEKLPLFIKSRN